MKLLFTSILLAAPAMIFPFVGEAHAANKSWHPESVAAREVELAKEFAGKGLKLGSPVFIRVYKHNGEVELWIQQGVRYVLFKTYRICARSGVLGPKFYEGDRQSPEGLYRITTQDLIVNPRWDRAMNINFPNNFDSLNGRGGSGILIHGGCGSIGCFAVQNEAVEDVYGAVRAALKGGQAYVPVLALPFRFAEVARDKEDTLQMSEFWGDLRRADLLFERDRIPPTAWICDGRYYFADRRGDRHRHAVHLPGCKPLDDPASARTARKSRPAVQDAGGEASAAVQVMDAMPEPTKRKVRAGVPARLSAHPRPEVQWSQTARGHRGYRPVVGRGPRRSRSAGSVSNTIHLRHHKHAA